MAQWHDLSFAFEEVLTSSKMNNMDENFDALAEQAAGAPGLQVRDGTAASPGLPFRDDGDTGIFRATADEISFSAGGTKRAHINTTGVFDNGVRVVSSNNPASSSEIGTDAIDSADQIAAGVVGQSEIATGAVGAPEIAAGAVGQSEIGGGAVHRGELDTESGSVSGTGRKTLPGGQYGFYPQIKNDLGDDTDARILDAEASTSFTTYINLSIPSGTSTPSALQRYINASPPYDLGDGECGLFIEVEIASDGKVIGSYVAPDPVWAHNGPTDVACDYIDKKTGKKYKRIRRPQLCSDDLEAGRADLQDWIAAKREAPVEEVEITPEFKNADMDLFPHSCASPPQGTICMLDPVQTHDLLMLHEDGEDIADLLHKGFILPGDEVSRHGPPGVKMISFKWRQSRKQ